MLSFVRRRSFGFIWQTANQPTKTCAEGWKILPVLPHLPHFTEEGEFNCACSYMHIHGIDSYTSIMKWTFVLQPSGSGIRAGKCCKFQAQDDKRGESKRLMQPCRFDCESL